jgi:hypothetical protein
LRAGESLMQFAERFKCQKCGAWYVAMWERSPLRTPAPGTFNCPDCGTLVHSWSGIEHYTNWRLLGRPLTAPIAPAGAITGSRCYGAADGEGCGTLGALSNDTNGAPHVATF